MRTVAGVQEGTPHTLPLAPRSESFWSRRSPCWKKCQEAEQKEQELEERALMVTKARTGHLKHVFDSSSRCNSKGCWIKQTKLAQAPAGRKSGRGAPVPCPKPLNRSDRKRIGGFEWKIPGRLGRELKTLQESSGAERSIRKSAI